MTSEDVNENIQFNVNELDGDDNISQFNLTSTDINELEQNLSENN